MSEETRPGADEAPVQEEIIEQPEAEGAEGEQQSPPMSETEKLAAKMGWAPKDQWPGRAEDHRSAEDFILKTQEINRSLKQEQERLRDDFGKRIYGIQRMSEHAHRVSEQALINQRQEIENKYAAAMRNATATGDVEQYDRLQNGLAHARQNFDDQMGAVVQQQDETGQQQPPAPEVQDFAVRNPWYMTDKTLTLASIGMLDDVDAKFPNFPLEKRLQMVEARMREEFPHKFQGKGNGAANPSTQQVEGGLRQIRTTSAKGFNQLPPEAKAQASKEVKQGIFKDVNAYAQEYFKYVEER